MRKLFLTVFSLSLALVLTLSLAACASVDAAAPQPVVSPSSLAVEPPVAPPADPATPPVTDPAQPGVAGSNPTALPTVTVQEEKLMVADAAIYRGTVTDVSDDWVITLEQAEGTNFGAPALRFTVSENTRVSFAAELLAEDKLGGRYLEVYYGRPVDETELDQKAVHEAIAINDLLTADMVNFNGTLTEIIYKEQDLNGTEGQLVMSNLENPDYVVVFNYGPETNFYLDFKSLKPGDKLNIYHSAAMTRSIPPQSAAYEVRPYYAGEQDAK